MMKNTSRPTKRWSDFQTQIARSNQRDKWTDTEEGVAVYRNNQFSGEVFVVVGVDNKSPLWKKIRLEAVRVNAPVNFEVYHIDGDKLNDKNVLRGFYIAWERLWKVGCCGAHAHVPNYKIVTPPTLRLASVAALGFTQHHMRFYQDSRLFDHPVGVLFGQSATSMCKDSTESEMVYKECPFCGSNTRKLWTLHSEEETYFGLSPVIEACRDCDRILSLQ